MSTADGLSQARDQQAQAFHHWKAKFGRVEVSNADRRVLTVYTLGAGVAPIHKSRYPAQLGHPRSRSPTSAIRRTSAIAAARLITAIA
jgi:hypothetical protein